MSEGTECHGFAYPVVPTRVHREKAKKAPHLVVLHTEKVLHPSFPLAGMIGL